MRGKPDAKYLIITCNEAKHWCGGIGDRLRGVKFAVKLAYATDRVLLIYDKKPVPLETILAPSLIDWTLNGINPEEGSSEEHFWYMHVHHHNRSQLDYSPFFAPTKFIWFFSNFAADVEFPKDSRLKHVPAIWGDRAMNTGQMFTREEMIGSSCMLRILFKASPELQADYDKLMLSLYNTTTPMYAAMHFRCGGMGDLGESQHIMRTADNIRALVSSLSCARHATMKHHIKTPLVVLTDNQALRKAILDGFLGDHTTTTRDKAAHIDWLPTGEDAKGDDVQRWVATEARQIYVDLMVLSGARCLIAGTRSGFNNLARAWGLQADCFMSWRSPCYELPMPSSIKTMMNLPHDW